MNALLLNRESFELPEDGWYHLAPLGVFPHAASGVVQVVDAEACAAMAAAFGVEAAVVNFAGLLIDFDHFSLDAGNKSEAAGWIVGLEARTGGMSRTENTESSEVKNAGGGAGVVEDFLTEARGHGGGDGLKSGKQKVESGKSSAGDGLWAKIRWSDTGEAAVRGGRYRFLSPVWSRADCVDLGDGRVRPVRLLNAAVTNDPNLKGLVPLSNSRGTAVGIRDKEEGIRDEIRTSNIEHRTLNVEHKILANADGDKRLKWVLGESPEDRHCPSCSALAGMVQTEAAWEAAGLRPKSGRLFCGEHCHCRLVETDEAVRGDLGIRELRNAECGVRSAEYHARKLVKEAKWALRNNWSEEARVASLEVRKAKAKKRDGDEEGQGAGGSEEERKKAEEKKKARERAMARAREKIEERLRRG